MSNTDDDLSQQFQRPDRIHLGGKSANRQIGKSAQIANPQIANRKSGTAQRLEPGAQLHRQGAQVGWGGRGLHGGKLLRRQPGQQCLDITAKAYQFVTEDCRSQESINGLS